MTIGWRGPVGCLELQVISAKETLIIGLFCGKWSIKRRHSMGLCQPVIQTCALSLSLSPSLSFPLSPLCVSHSLSLTHTAMRTAFKSSITEWFYVLNLIVQFTPYIPLSHTRTLTHTTVRTASRSSITDLVCSLSSCSSRPDLPLFRSTQTPMRTVRTTSRLSVTDSLCSISSCSSHPISPSLSHTPSENSF